MPPSYGNYPPKQYPPVYNPVEKPYGVSNSRDPYNNQIRPSNAIYDDVDQSSG